MRYRLGALWAIQHWPGPTFRRGNPPGTSGRSVCSIVSLIGLSMRPVTLQDLINDGKFLWCYCRECGRERDVDPATLPLPASLAVPSVGGRMRCVACGSKKIDSKPELYLGGIEAMRQRRRELG